MADNKVVFGLKNAHYSVITDTAGVLTYATPVALLGLVEISLEPKGDPSDFYADDILFYTTTSNQGYTTTLSVANITEDFRKDVLGETIDATDFILTENSSSKPKQIAFMFEFDGDLKATRHVLYHCTVTRPTISSSTKTETTEPTPQELSLIAAPRPTDGIVKRSTTSTTTTAVYDAWYDAVYTPTV